MQKGADDKDSRALTGMAAISAVVGDLLGVTGGLIQAALIPMSQAPTGAGSASAQTVVALESTFSTAGFLLVGVSFLLFGFSILGGTFGKWLGWVAIAAGVFSILGQIPVLAALFMLANLALFAVVYRLGCPLQTEFIPRILMKSVVPTTTWQPEEVVKFAASMKPLFEPGSGSSYSNANYILLGLIAEK